MTRPVAIIQAPYSTRSGYGEMSRDIIRHIIELGQYDVMLVSTNWGSCPMNALDPSRPEDKVLIDHTAQPPIQLQKQPELFIQISVPNEFQPIAKHNIGITAGMETTLVSPQWLEGANKMDLILTISEHSKRVFEQTRYAKKDQNGNVVGELKLDKPIEVLHNCVDTRVFKKVDVKEIPDSVRTQLAGVKEDFAFLFVGHWLKGNLGEDRKNVGLLINVFCETFKGLRGPKPALILKTSGAGFSLMDQESIVDKIRQVRSLSGEGAPNVYLLHGELTEEEMNGLYNHPKVKAHVSFTKGEGFGRPLLEATLSKKPVIASGWSGHLDFLNPDDAILVGGELRNVEPGAVWENVILAESQWFNIDPNQASGALRYVFGNVGKATDGAYRLAAKNAVAFSYDKIKERTKELLDQYVPKFAVQVPIKLPQLKKLTPKPEAPANVTSEG
jgi:hypothetical protein